MRVLARTVVAALLSIGPVVAEPVGTADAAKEITIAQSGPPGPVTVIGDSVLLGSGLYSPTRQPSRER